MPFRRASQGSEGSSQPLTPRNLTLRILPTERRRVGRCDKGMAGRRGGRIPDSSALSSRKFHDHRVGHSGAEVGTTEHHHCQPSDREVVQPIAHYCSLAVFCPALVGRVRWSASRTRPFFCASVPAPRWCPCSPCPATTARRSA